MNNEEMIKKLSSLFGVEESELRTIAAYDLIAKTSFELTALALFVKKYGIMIPENCDKFEKIVKQYLMDLHTITADEADIERLRDAY